MIYIFYDNKLVIKAKGFIEVPNDISKNYYWYTEDFNIEEDRWSFVEDGIGSFIPICDVPKIYRTLLLLHRG